MSNRRRQLRADVAAFRGRGDDLLVDLFAVGTPLRGRPHESLKRRTLLYYEAGSYFPGSQHRCFCCGWRFQSRARLAGAYLIAVHAADPRPTSAAVSAACDACWHSESVSMSEIEIAAARLLRVQLCPHGKWT